MEEIFRLADFYNLLASNLKLEERQPFVHLLPHNYNVYLLLTPTKSVEHGRKWLTWHQKSMAFFVQCLRLNISNYQTS